MSQVSGADRLVLMANQIAGFFATQPRMDGAAAVADHLHSFWTPTMRAAFIAHAREGDDHLHPLAAEAATLLAAGITPKVTVATRPGDDAG